MTKTIEIRGLDTVLFRDGRPFDATPGGRARGLTVPFPSTLAGFVRTQAGRTARDYEQARAIKHAGPLLVRNQSVLFAAPADAVPFRGDEGLRLMCLRPFEAPDGTGCDVPGGMLPLRVTEDVKPEAGFAWWTQEVMFRWLEDELPDIAAMPKHLGPVMDERVHIAMDRATGTTEEGALFSTSMTAFERLCEGKHTTWSCLCQISEPDDVEAPTGPGLLGGEQRVGLIESAKVAWPSCPTSLAERLEVARHVRLILATPAIFERGWMPGWLDKTTKTGSPPGCEGVTLQLVSAAVPRRQAVSGWEMEGNRPKPVRWLSPAGSVYFFKVTEGNPSCLPDNGWLAPVSDLEQSSNGATPKSNNRDDGFGLALWGVWSQEGEQR